VAQKVREIVYYLSSPMGVHEDLFIGEVMGLTTMSSIPLTTYPANRARGRGAGGGRGHPVYYIR
jgi:hypothetical protein